MLAHHKNEVTLSQTLEPARTGKLTIRHHRLDALGVYQRKQAVEQRQTLSGVAADRPERCRFVQDVPFFAELQPQQGKSKSFISHTQHQNVDAARP